MKTILKNIELNTKKATFKKDFLMKTSIDLASDNWFKGSRSRGIR